jgi:hypothetical protein
VPREKSDDAITFDTVLLEAGCAAGAATGSLLTFDCDVDGTGGAVNCVGDGCGEGKVLDWGGWLCTAAEALALEGDTCDA